MMAYFQRLTILKMDNVAYLISTFEAEIRLTVFLVVLSVMAGWEIVAPRRNLIQSKSIRWMNNLGLVVLNSLVLRIFFPAATAGLAWYAANNQLGVFNQLHLVGWLEAVIAFIVLDLTVYIQHVVFHKVPILWRIHRVHHLDLDFDITTGLRFHPIEIMLSMLIKGVIVLSLGVPVIAAVLFEITLNTTAVFNHGNVRIPKRIDRFVRYLFVTPDMHRVHHSIVRNETNSNYGFSLSFWDRIFGTYRDQPENGHRRMTIGLENPRRPEQCIPLLMLLRVPFVNFDKNRI